MSEGSFALDLTADGVHFAEWQTVVQDDDLELVSINLANDHSLVATFACERLQADVVFTFSDVRAFRVVDEGGLLQLWAASKSNPRPAQTTFCVRGHQWQSESPLAWLHGTDKPYFSYMIATDWDCLEVVAFDPPEVGVKAKP
ncbi:hypothetical protein [Erythrobacter sp.]|uniref:hypothetical protein n=1 Tax=Erythrobacter sp. TaxID=1042 RepID=UPI00311D43FC